MGPIYLDYLGSTPLDPAVLEAMLPWLGHAGNPHAAHRAGWRAETAIEQALDEIAALSQVGPGEIVLTSGATEANNLALLGAVPAGWPVAVSAIEHSSVLNCLAPLAARGHRTEIIPVDRSGRVDLAAIERVLADGPAFISVMAANNEIGTIQDIAGIAGLCHSAGGLLHSDAVQLLATAPMPSGADLITLSGHKLYGPQGIGALAIRDGVALAPRVIGGGQQRGRRAGTVPVALAVGFGVACHLARRQRAADASRLRGLRDRFWTGLAARIPGITRNSPERAVLPGCLNVSIPGIAAADLLLDLPDLIASTGAACGSGVASSVLTAVGLDASAIHGSLRFGLGRETSLRDIDRAIGLLTSILSEGVTWN